MLDDAATPTLLLQQPVRRINNVALSELSLYNVPLGHLFNTVWTLSTENQTWEGIWFKSDSTPVWTQPKDRINRMFFL